MILHSSGFSCHGSGRARFLLQGPIVGASGSLPGARRAADRMGRGQQRKRHESTKLGLPARPCDDTAAEEIGKSSMR
jgi:hypothetical protein